MVGHQDICLTTHLFLLIQVEQQESNMFHGAHIIRPGEYGIFLYKDKDHQQECLRRVARQEPTTKIVAFTSVTKPDNAIKCFVA